MMNQIPDVYDRPLGLPLYWMDEQSGKLRAAVRDYFSWVIGEADEPKTGTTELLRQYLEHFVNAPCWRGHAAELARLRAKVKGIKTCGDIRGWLGEALNIGLDPF